MKKNTEHPLRPEQYFHIYNRGIDGETLFKQPRNYPYFLQQYTKYIAPVADTYAYALMGNHFHLLVCIKTEAEIREQLAAGALGVEDKAKAAEKTIEQIVSNQFAKLFNSYAQSINNQEKLGVGGKRTGGLLEEPFRRIPIFTQDYLMRMVYYCHFNPQKHGFVNDFRDYPHTSFESFVRTGNTRLMRDEVLSWFGGIAGFLDYHQIGLTGSEWDSAIWIEEE